MAGSAEQSPNGTRSSVSAFTDQPWNDDRRDLLGYGAFADALAELIDHPQTETPLIIAISAPWGAGKTTLARLVEQRLRKWPEQRGERPHLTCWFNAWMHDDNPYLDFALAAEISTEANKHRSISRRFARPRSSALLSPKQRTYRRLLLLGGFFIATIATTCAILYGESDLKAPVLKKIFGNNVPPAAEGIATILAGIVLIFIILTAFFSIFQAFAGFVKDPRKGVATGSALSKRLGRLLQEARGSNRKIVIFVDDLDRCRPPRAVEVCEVANKLLSHPGVVTVLIGNMTSIASIADVKYGPLEGRYPATDTVEAGSDDPGKTYGQHYLQKIVQIQFDLPLPPVGAMRRLINNSPIDKPPHEPKGGSSNETQVLKLPPLSRRERILDVASRLGWKVTFGFSSCHSY